MSMENWVKAFCSIFVEPAGSQKNALVESYTSISVESAGSHKIT